MYYVRLVIWPQPDAVIPSPCGVGSQRAPGEAGGCPRRKVGYGVRVYCLAAVSSCTGPRIVTVASRSGTPLVQSAR